MADISFSRRSTLQAVAAAAAAAFAHRLISAWRARRRFDGLEGIVSFSSRIIAAWRSLESEQGGALFQDPLAAVLAGRTALQRAQRRAEEQGNILPMDLQTRSGRRYEISRVAIRTVWFDTELLAALDADRQWQPLLARAASDGSGGVKLDLHRNATPRQVVLLGAGMDTRAWRLKLPAGTRWFEVDKADVLVAKHAALRQAGAAFEASAGSTAAHPLRAASYAALEADLGVKGWTAALAATGWDRSQPTVWLAEGLIMYLQPTAALTMMEEIAGASAPGSAFLSVSVTEAVITRLHLKRRGNGSSDLVSQFVFGCPQDPSQMFAEHGWRVQDYTTRQEMVEDFRLDPRLMSNVKPPAKDCNSLFIVATPLPDRHPS